MKIYLLRHAIAKKRNISKYPDDNRPLTAIGRRKMQQIARGICKICRSTDLIITSPMLRATETADIISQSVKCRRKIKKSEKFMPGTEIRLQLKFIQNLKSLSSIFIVGHQPDLSELASMLLGNKNLSLDFRKGGVCLIMLEKSNNTFLKEFISPKVLIKLAGKVI